MTEYYYVTAERRGKYAPLYGPVAYHYMAENMVKRVRDLAAELQPESHWWSFGVTKLTSSQPFAKIPRGSTNKYFEQTLF